MSSTMPPSSRPYQSKILKFVLQRWQQGLERQSIAWRQLQITAVRGAQILALPIYVTMQAMQRASITLNSSSSEASPLGTANAQSSSQAQVTDLEHSMTAIWTYTHQTLSPRQVQQLKLSPSQSVSSDSVQSKQTRLRPLTKYLKQGWLGRFLGHHPEVSPNSLNSPNSARQDIVRIGFPHKHPPNQKSHRGKTSAKHVNSSDSLSTALLRQQGLTLASSLVTQQLVLVTLTNEVFDIFTPEQQQELQHYIQRVMDAYRHTRMLVVHPAQTLSTRRTVLPFGERFLRSLAPAFRYVWTQLTSSQTPERHPPNRRGGPQSRSRLFTSIPPHSLSSQSQQLPHSSNYQGFHQLSSQSPHALETSVHEVKYLPHPLERLLRWLDRVLSWCEHRWQQCFRSNNTLS